MVPSTGHMGANPLTGSASGPAPGEAASLTQPPSSTSWSTFPWPTTNSLVFASEKAASPRYTVS